MFCLILYIKPIDNKLGSNKIAEYLGLYIYISLDISEASMHNQNDEIMKGPLSACLYNNTIINVRPTCISKVTL